MARIAEDEIARLKREISVERLAEARGVKLARHGADLLGLCPFHDDREPSLVVSPKKNLWHCLGACQAGGSAIDWVMRAEGVSFRLACELLRKDAPSLASSLAKEGEGAKPLTKHSTVVKLPKLLERDAGDEELLVRVADYYHATLKESPEALKYLEARGIRSAEAIEHFRIGYSNRTLGYRIPRSNRVEGEQVRGRLEELGILRESGHEHFNGSVVFPIFDESGKKVVGMYGRKIHPNLAARVPRHMYLPGPHRGVWNGAALATATNGEAIVCEAIIDALTFWCAGYRNVIAAYGVEGFTNAHWSALESAKTKVVRIAYDRDEAGDRAAEELGRRMNERGIETYRVTFPKGMDANAYARKVLPATRSLGLALRKAEWMGKGEAPAREDDVELAHAVSDNDEADGTRANDELVDEPAIAHEDLVVATECIETSTSEPDIASQEPIEPASHEASIEPARREEKRHREPEREVFPSLAALSRSPSPPRIETATPATSSPSAAPPATSSTERDEVVFTFGERRWRVRGLGKNLSFGQLRVNIGIHHPQGGFFVDTLDLYAARHRESFVRQATVELGMSAEVMKRDLGEVLLGLEKRQEELIESTLRPKTATVAMTESERDEAMMLLRDPRLLERVIEDFDACGVVGEHTNKLVGYLAATSRKLEEPLAVVIQSSSAAGKSSLMDAVLSFVPEEERVSYSAMTGQSLFYMGEQDLQHKVLAVVEEEGAERASYALKLLQSEGELTIASTGKDPITGKLVTHTYRVVGPVGLFLTTTAITVDEELLNRCIVLTVDEGKEQTRAIHALQRESQTLEGMIAKVERKRIRTLHQNAQRLLSPLLVVNPFARELSFADSRTRTRRDHMKYLTLIRTVALLHQHQREVKTTEHRGQVLRYIEATREDLAIAEKLASAVLGRGLDELPPQTRRLLELVETMVTERASAECVAKEHVRFSRREVREHTGWGHTQMKVHMQRLEELEYVLVHRGARGQSNVYELAIERAHARTTEKWSGWSGSGRPQVGDRSGHEADHFANASSTVFTERNASSTQVVGAADHHISGASANGTSYARTRARAAR